MIRLLVFWGLYRPRNHNKAHSLLGSVLQLPDLRHFALEAPCPWLCIRSSTSCSSCICSAVCPAVAGGCAGAASSPSCSSSFFNPASCTEAKIQDDAWRREFRVNLRIDASNACLATNYLPVWRFNGYVAATGLPKPSLKRI